MNMETKFWKKVGITNPDKCWPWLGASDKYGYGYYYIKGKHVRAHRYAYSLVYGINDESNDIHHTCDKPYCCNFHHLEEVTRADNIRAKPTYNADNYPCGHPRTKENTYAYGVSNHCRKCH